METSNWVDYVKHNILIKSEVTPENVSFHESHLSGLLIEDQLTYSFVLKKEDGYIYTINPFLYAIFKGNLAIAQAIQNFFPNMKHQPWSAKSSDEKQEKIKSSHHPIRFFLQITTANQFIAAKDLKWLLEQYSKKELESVSGVYTNGVKYENCHVLGTGPFEYLKIDSKQVIREFFSYTDQYLVDAINSGHMNHTFVFSGKQDFLDKLREVFVASKNLSFSTMIGMEKVKKQIDKVLSGYLVAKKRNFPRQVPKMIFVGDTGVGKTETAKVCAHYLHQHGLLSSPDIISLTGSQLKAQWVGHTTKSVNELFDKAEQSGRLLFIDEFYSAVNSKSQNTEFANDAIGVLLDRIEKMKTGSAIIIAGYPAEIKEALLYNQGFMNRFNDVVFFENYSTTDCVKIFEKFLGAYDLTLSEQLKQHTTDKIEQLKSLPHFANVREMRNFADDVFKNVSFRHEEEKMNYEVTIDDIIFYENNMQVMNKLTA